MKNLYLIFLFVVLISCQSEDLDHKESFEKSYQTWQKFKKDTDNSYQYKTVFSSWVGSFSETTITVSKGKIIKRDFKNTPAKDDTNSKVEEWTENENEIGIHKNGAKPLTLDEIYQKAKENWLKKRGNATTYFEAKNNGLISTCGYVENGCADDCFIGIKIESIKAL